MAPNALLALLLFSEHFVGTRALKSRREGYDGLDAASQRAFLARIKVVYLNDDRATLKDKCMRTQMTALVEEAAALDLSLVTERVSAMVFKNCTDEASCVQEHPECFSNDRRFGYVETEKRNQVAAHFCTHMGLFEKLKTEANDYDLFLILEDDVLLLPGILSKLGYLFKLPYYWDVVALDNFKTGLKEDRIQNDADLELFSLSAAKTAYAGAHAWLVNADRIERLSALFHNSSVVPNDVVLRLPRPLHLGVWSFASGHVRHARDLPKDTLSKLSTACQAWANPELKDKFAIPFSEKGILQGTSTLDGVEAPKEVSAPQYLAGWESTSVSKTRSVAPGNRTTPRELIVFGMYSSGTKMLSDLIQKNLEEPNSVELCKNYTARGYCGRIWKHLHPRRFLEFQQARSNTSEPMSEAIAVVLVRHPFSVIRSLLRHSYDMSCAGGRVNHTADISRPASMAMEPCSYWEPDPKWFTTTQPSMSRIANATCERVDGNTLDGSAMCWKSLPEAWNSYVSGYSNWATENYFHKTLILRYEDVVEFPEVAVRQIAQSVGLTQPDHIENVVKMLGRAGWGFVGRTKSLERLKIADYNTSFSCEEARSICKLLDPSLMYKFGYHGCQSMWPGWARLMAEGHTMNATTFTSLQQLNVKAESSAWC